MKVMVVSWFVCNDVMSYIHGGGENIRCLAFWADSEMYVITPYLGHIFVELIENERLSELKIEKEIDVPAEFIDRVIESKKAQKQLLDELNTLLST